MSFEKVIAARSFESGGVCVVALIAAPIFSYAERVALLNEVEEAVQDKIGGRAVATFSSEVYRKIVDGASDEDKNELLTLALKTREKHNTE